MKANLLAKSLKTYVHYQNPSKELLFGDVGNHISKINDENTVKVFTKGSLKEEVKKLNPTQKEKKKFKKLMQAATTSASSLIIALPVSAQENTDIIAELPSHEELIRIALWLIGYTTIATIVVGICWVVVTRILHYMPVEQYKKWALEIATGTIKGITEVLTLPTIIMIIIGVAVLLFGGIPGFNLPF